MPVRHPVRPAHTRQATRRENPLPSPSACRGAELSIEGPRQRHSPTTQMQVALMKLAHRLQMGRQSGPNGRGQHRHPILPTLPSAQADLEALEIEIRKVSASISRNPLP